MTACFMEYQYILEWIFCLVIRVTFIIFRTTILCEWCWEKSGWQLLSIICLNKPLNTPCRCADSCEQLRKPPFPRQQHLLNRWDEPNYPRVSVCSPALSRISGLISFIRGNSWTEPETSFTQWVVLIFTDSHGILTCAPWSAGRSKETHWLFLQLSDPKPPLAKTAETENCFTLEKGETQVMAPRCRVWCRKHDQKAEQCDNG